jgi:hypothetical protein
MILYILKNSVFRKFQKILMSFCLIVVCTLISSNAENSTTVQLKADPRFESGYSGFYRESCSDSLSRTTSQPIFGLTSLAVSQCNPASKIVDETRTVTSSLTLDPKLSIRRVSIKLESSGSNSVTYLIHDVTAELIYPSLFPTPVSSKAISGVWANEGGDKVAREEIRFANAKSVVSRAWNGSKVQIFGAKNEVVSFNTVLEAAVKQANNVSVSFNSLVGPGGYLIKSTPATGDGVFDWTNRDIELFYVRYLKITGVSKLAYDGYDERHVPERLRRPWSGAGVASGLWTDRPDHDKSYPDIAVPVESVPSFNIASGQNQSIWADVYIPKDAPAGIYTGAFQVFESGVLSYTIPVNLTVRNFTLPDVSTAKTMLHLGYGNISYRYLGVKYVYYGSAEEQKLRQIRDRHFALAHRHRISLVDSNSGKSTASATRDQPVAEWLPRLDGSLFTKAKGYRGPGEGVGNGIFSIGEYGSWYWQSEGETGMWKHTDAWANWFANNAPSIEKFLYLIDESLDYAQIQKWASLMDSNPSIGKIIPSMATVRAPLADTSIPNLDVITSVLTVGDTATWDKAISSLKARGSNIYFYNGARPASGSFATDDDGIALRELAWGQYKKGIQRWFFWESTYYDNFQGGTGQTDVFTQARTFGGPATYDSVNGMSGWNTSNGEGVLFYPGTDKVFPANNYNLNGPLASLRLKHWRRGIQDVDYITLANAINPVAVSQIVNSIIPKVLWENGISDPIDPSWVRCDISWSSNPDVWEEARIKLANIIETGNP